MSKTIKRIGIFIGAFAALAILGIAYIAVTFDANRYKGEITRIVKEKKQRSLKIDGDLSLSFFPNIGVKLGKTTLSEHGSEQIFAALDSVRVSVALMPLLSKQLVVDTVELGGVNATLVRHADGTLNIDDLLSKEKDDSQAVRFDVTGIRLSNAQLGWRDEKSGQTASVSKVDLATGRIGNAAVGKLELTLHLSANQPKSEADLKLAGNYDFNLNQKRFSLSGLDAAIKGELAGVQGFDLQFKAASFAAQTAKLSLAASGLSLSAKGKQGEADFNLHLEVPKLELAAAKDGTTGGVVSASLSGTLDLAHPKMPMKSLKLPVSGSVRADFAAQSADVALNTQFDESKIALKLNVEKFSPLVFGFDVDIDKLNVDKYLPAQKGTTKSGGGDDRVNLSALKTLNLHGTIKIGALQVSNVKASHIRLDVRAGGGKLDIAPLSANLYGGAVSGSLSASASGNAIALKQTLTNININPLLVDVADKDLVEGHGNVALDLATHGDSVTALKKTLSGSASVSLRDGALKGINLAQTFRDLKGKLSAQQDTVQQAKSGDKTDFSELGASFKISSGVAHNDDLAMKSPFIRLGGGGDIDIGNGGMNYLAKASVVTTSGGQGAKDLEQLKGVTVPVRVSGPFDSLSFKLELASLVSDAAKAKVVEKKQEVQQKLQDSARDKLKGLLGR